MLAVSIWFWIGFVAFVLAMLALDLGVFHRTPHEVRPKEAGIWVAVWVALALAFAAGLHFWAGKEVALTFLTGYVIEEVAQRRQHLRDGADLRVLPRAEELPAPRAVLRHPRRAGDARAVHRGRRGARLELPLGPVRLRRAARRHRRAHGDQAGRGVRRRAEQDREAGAALPADVARVQGQALLHGREWPPDRDAAAARADSGRVHGSDLRDRLDSRRSSASRPTRFSSSRRTSSP